MTLLRALGFSRHLPAADRRIFLQALFLLPAARLWLASLGFRRALALARRKPLQRPAPPGDPAAQAGRVAQLWSLAARRGWPGGTCLSQSLSLWWLLRLHGLPGDLQIGVRTEGGQLQAHAWVEWQGQPLNDRPDSLRRYSAFEGLPLPEAVNWA